MPTRTLNATGRSRITKAMFSAHGSGGFVTVKWDMSNLDLDSACQLFIVLRNGALEDRHEIQDISLDSDQVKVPVRSELQRDFVNVQLVVTQRDQRNVPLIRASSVIVAVNLETGESTSDTPLLLVAREDLAVPWQLDFGGDLKVLVSNRDSLWTNRTSTSPEFEAAILPAIVFEIAIHVLSGALQGGKAESDWVEILEVYGLQFFEDMEMAEAVSIAREVAERFSIQNDLVGNWLRKVQEQEK